MDNKSKIVSTIGMANRAGKIVSGQDSVRNSIRRKKVKLIIIAEDASDNTKKRFLNCANHYGIPSYVCMTKYDFSRSLKGKIRSVIGVADLNFSLYLERLIHDTLQSKTGGELFE